MPAEAIAIAIDGPASSGKGTVARLVAEALGFSYVDTGAMYRCVALAAARLGVPWSEGPALAALIPSLHFELRFEAGRLAVRVNGEDVSEAIRAETISLGASAVATLPEVRTALLEGQRALARRGGVVMDGRDIGTVVLPDAALKVYLDADVDERARRRQAELAAKGQALTVEAVRDDLRARDAQDMQRATAPLRQAEDAVFLDSTGRTPQQLAQEIVLLAQARGA